ncbi:hypothetical protein P280DRAFT_530835, partial [Massarina eburnea CBS 473.64]
KFTSTVTRRKAFWYPYFKYILLALISGDSYLASLERKKILGCAGEAIQELHGKDYIPLHVMADNTLVNRTCDEKGRRTVTDAILGDFDIAFKWQDGKPRRISCAIGNVMWRSPEGQTGRGMSKA